MRFSQRVTALIVCLLLCLAVGSVFAGKFIPIVNGVTLKDGSAFVIINNMRVIQLKTSNGTLSPTDRAAVVVDRLTAMVQQGLDPNTITIKATDTNARIFVGDVLLVISTTAEAKTRGISTSSLAQQWAGNIVTALALPPLYINPTTLLIPLGETRPVEIKCLTKSQVTFEISDQAIASIDFEKKPGFLIVKGLKAGDAVITLNCEDYSAKVQIAVREYAASNPEGDVRGIVTGRDTPKSLVARTAIEAARRTVLLKPGAKIISIEAPDSLSDLPPARNLQVNVKVEAQGNQYIPARLTIPVTISNQAIPTGATSSIFYSNDPETVLKYQYLFIGTTKVSEEPIRLLYHHQNKMYKRIGFVIDVVNPSSNPASLHVIEGIAPPMVDTVVVGYRAGLDFMENLRANIGRVIEIPPGTRQILVAQGVDSQSTASGILELHQVLGDPLTIRVIAKPDSLRTDEDPLGTVIPANGFNASQYALSNQVFPKPRKEVATTYVAGKPWLFYRIGKEAIKHASLNKVLYGNYGVTYNIKAKLENPLDQEYEVEIAFEATAGPASGVFYLDGNLVSFKLLRSSEEATIGKLKIQPGKTRNINIRTILLSGSAYPATIIIRPTASYRMISEQK